MASNALIAKLAGEAGVTETQYHSTLMKTIMPSGSVSPEHVLAFLQVAGKYKLNPLTKEIFAFPGKNGGVVPVVSVDGWLSLANRHEQFDGMTHEDVFGDDGDLVAVKCSVYRKDRAHPVTAIEYMCECRRNVDTWRTWPRRMLRHKATIQAIRYAFGFAGIMEPDEAERWHEAQTVEVPQGNGGTASLKQRMGIDAEQAPTIKADDLMIKIAEAKAHPHINNIVTKYAGAAEALCMLDEFMAAAEAKRQELADEKKGEDRE